MMKNKIATIEAVATKMLESGLTPIFLGPPGVGKTETSFRIARKFVSEDKIYMLNASQTSKEDLSLPVLRNDDGKTIDIATHDFNNSTIILDELTNANPALMSALLSLILEHRIGNTVFENLHIIATGNRDTESFLANELPDPLKQRLAMMDFPVPSYDEWEDYMMRINKDYHPYYMAFMHSNPSLLWGEESNTTAWEQRPSPRSHSRLSKFLKDHYPTRNSILANDTEVSMAAEAIVGKQVALPFLGYMRDEKNHLAPEDFFKGKKIPKNSSQYMHLIVASAGLLRAPEDLNIGDVNEVDKYVEEVADKLDMVVGAGLDSDIPGLAGMASLAPRYITGYTDMSGKSAEGGIVLNRILQYLSSKKGDESAFVRLIKSRAAMATRSRG